MTPRPVFMVRLQAEPHVADPILALHLNQEQRRTLIADELRERPERSINQIAIALGVSDTTVGTVRSELESTSQIGKLETTIGADGKSRPTKRPKIAALDFGTDGAKATTTAAKAIRAVESNERYAARVTRIAEVSAVNAPLETGRRYPVIYADPPWDYRLYSETTGSQRAAAEHYPTMKLDEICALPVADIAADDAILFMWTTAPHLQESNTRPMPCG
jgi:MT-A70